MKNIFLLLVLLLPAARSFACLNEYYAINAEGKLVPLGGSWKMEEIYKSHNQAKAAAKLIALEKLLKKEKNYMLLSDYAVGLMKLGKAKEALEILKVLYKHYPTEYRIVANLGTAYELNGQPDSALKYIRLDLKLNPDDHQGSEWIHVKILEAELALKKDPQWLKAHTVLQLSEKQEKDPGTREHLLIQLHERVPFTPAPNELVGDLFVDLGDITSYTGTAAYARAYYRVAKNYYEVADTSLDEKIKRMTAVLKKYASVQPKRTEYDKGSQERVDNIGVDDILGEQPNWGNEGDPKKVNINVVSLLAMANYPKTQQQLKDSIEANGTLLRGKEFSGHTEEYLPAKKDTLGQAISQEEKTTAPEGKRKPVWPYPVTGGGIVVVITAVIAARRRRNRK